MSLLVLLFLTAACLPEARAYSLTDWNDSTRLFATACLCGFGMLAACTLSAFTVRGAHSTPERRSRAIRRYSSTRWFLFFVNLSAAVVAILACGWGQYVDVHFRIDWQGERVLAPFAELLVPAPYLANVIANWFIYYPAERALSRTSGKPRSQGFWSLLGFVLFNARQFALLVLFPVMLFASMKSALRFFPEWLEQDAFQLVSLFAMIGFFVFLPRLVKPLLGLKSLPAGPYRSQLETLEQRLSFRRTDLLLWPTRGGAANALILGVVPQARYVIFTDTLLESLTPPELDAVFGHEVGHAIHGHLAYYALFLLLSATAIGGLTGVANEYAERWGAYEMLPGELQWMWKFGPILLMGTYLFLVFGWLSRVCERQADIAGARAGSCGEPHCSGHEESDPIRAGSVSDGDSLTRRLRFRLGKSTLPCETGLRAMVMALEAVTGMNGMAPEARRGFAARWLAWFRSWQHGPPNARIEYLQSLMVNPELARVHDRYAYRVRWGIAIVLAAILAASTAAMQKS